MKSSLTHLILFLVTFALSAGLTPLVRKLAIRFGQVAEPREDRWHRRPTAVMGGVAIAASFYLAVLAVTIFLPAAGMLSTYLPLLICAFLVFTLGLVDDIYRLAPQTKLVGQIIAASFLVFFGFKINWFESYTFNRFFSVFWIVGITNAFNLLDNMDGLAAGIAFISLLFLAVITMLNLGGGSGNGHLLIIALFMGALLGFLLYNFHPASIFMGDSGSSVPFHSPPAHHHGSSTHSFYSNLGHGLRLGDAHCLWPFHSEGRQRSLISQASGHRPSGAPGCTHSLYFFLFRRYSRSGWCFVSDSLFHQPSWRLSARFAFFLDLPGESACIS
ncbi:MAG: MraY family glycosyltransferase [Deltaproteobacteria bacterium]